MDPTFAEFLKLLAAGLIGYFIGHRFALGRDKRVEFNVAAAPIRAYLVEESGDPSGFREAPSKSELDAFESRLNWWRREGFRRAWQDQSDAYMAGWRQDLKTGEIDLVDDVPVKAALRRCLRYTKSR
jgi:hypothetical protein